MSDDNEGLDEGLGEFPSEVHVIYMQDGKEFYPCVYRTLEEVDVDDAAEGRCAIYKLVREGTVKRRPSTIKFIPNKGSK